MSHSAILPLPLLVLAAPVSFFVLVKLTPSRPPLLRPPAFVLAAHTLAAASHHSCGSHLGFFALAPVLAALALLPPSRPCSQCSRPLFSWLPRSCRRHGSHPSNPGSRRPHSRTHHSRSPTLVTPSLAAVILAAPVLAAIASMALQPPFSQYPVHPRSSFSCGRLPVAPVLAASTLMAAVIAAPALATSILAASVLVGSVLAACVLAPSALATAVLVALVILAAVLAPS
ncbi:hypothetical protein BOTBODRAFT_175500 [Botryobasidium botryosum FD-172 SS1]|uniref:Uncharacterized protein n=1 Tax=Botryobasidium botryosum (strain FD-172 SS1) TaxID=930990 RepID=A0A067MD63_BOTB1|nr:hypothetical protein BOTBODRAFT_175500 [Botryobasidium botryosum FD-172 SS1]